MKNFNALPLLAGLLILILLAASAQNAPTTFVVRLEAPTGNLLKTSKGDVAAPFSPGVWVVHKDAAPVFNAGKPNRGEGLEAQSEDGNPTKLAESMAMHMAGKTGVFNTPVGDSKAGPATPGKYFEFEVKALPGENLTFTSMFGQSNDWFWAPDENGIALFKDGKPISGDVSSQVYIWDAGTEADEEPGVGPNQAPRQSAPNTGPADPNNTVRKVEGMYAPNLAAMPLKVTITPKQ